jgi:plasmid maintenance system antidote protein VapI
MSIFDKIFKRKRKLYSFEPDYVARPSETIKECMEQADIDNFSLWAANPFIELTAFNNMMNDKLPISKAMAIKLSSVLGGEPEFWVNLSKKYFDALKLKGGE